MQSPIDMPHRILTRIAQAEVSVTMGLLPEINRAWISLDRNVNDDGKSPNPEETGGERVHELLLWNYDYCGTDIGDNKHSEVYGYPHVDALSGFSQPICAVALVAPRGTRIDTTIANDEAIKHLLVVATPAEVCIFALMTDRSSGNFRIFGSEDGGPLFSFSTDGILFTQIRGTPTGRIFLGGSDGCVHELLLEPTGGVSDPESESTLRAATRLTHSLLTAALATGGSLLGIPGAKTLFGNARRVNLTVPPIKALLSTFLTGNVPSGGAPLIDMTIDHYRALLYTLDETGCIRVYSLLGDKGSEFRKTAEVEDLDLAALQLLQSPQYKHKLASPVFSPGAGKFGVDCALNNVPQKFTSAWPPVSLAIVPPTVSQRVHLVVTAKSGYRFYFSTYTVNKYRELATRGIPAAALPVGSIAEGNVPLVTGPAPALFPGGAGAASGIGGGFSGTTPGGFPSSGLYGAAALNDHLPGQCLRLVSIRDPPPAVLQTATVTATSHPVYAPVSSLPHSFFPMETPVAPGTANTAGASSGMGGSGLAGAVASTGQFRSHMHASSTTTGAGANVSPNASGVAGTRVVFTTQRTTSTPAASTSASASGTETGGAGSVGWAGQALSEVQVALDLPGRLYAIGKLTALPTPYKTQLFTDSGLLVLPSGELAPLPYRAPEIRAGVGLKSPVAPSASGSSRDRSGSLVDATTSALSSLFSYLWKSDSGNSDRHGGRSRPPAADTASKRRRLANNRHASANEGSGAHTFSASGSSGSSANSSANGSSVTQAALLDSGIPREFHSYVQRLLWGEGIGYQHVLSELSLQHVWKSSFNVYIVLTHVGIVKIAPVRPVDVLRNLLEQHEISYLRSHTPPGTTSAAPPLHQHLPAPLVEFVSQLPPQEAFSLFLSLYTQPPLVRSHLEKLFSERDLSPNGIVGRALLAYNATSLQALQEKITQFFLIYRGAPSFKSYMYGDGMAPAAALPTSAAAPSGTASTSGIAPTGAAPSAPAGPGVASTALSAPLPAIGAPFSKDDLLFSSGMLGVLLYTTRVLWPLWGQSVFIAPNRPPTLGNPRVFATGVVKYGWIPSEKWTKLLKVPYSPIYAFPRFSQDEVRPVLDTVNALLKFMQRNFNLLYEVEIRKKDSPEADLHIRYLLNMVGLGKDMGYGYESLPPLAPADVFEASTISPYVPDISSLNESKARAQQWSRAKVAQRAEIMEELHAVLIYRLLQRVREGLHLLLVLTNPEYKVVEAITELLKSNASLPAAAATTASDTSPSSTSDSSSVAPVSLTSLTSLTLQSLVTSSQSVEIAHTIFTHALRYLRNNQATAVAIPPYAAQATPFQRALGLYRDKDTPLSQVIADQDSALRFSTYLRTYAPTYFTQTTDLRARALSYIRVLDRTSNQLDRAQLYEAAVTTTLEAIACSSQNDLFLGKQDYFAVVEKLQRAGKLNTSLSILFAFVSSLCKHQSDRISSLPPDAFSPPDRQSRTSQLRLEVYTRILATLDALCRPTHPAKTSGESASLVHAMVPHIRSILRANASEVGLSSQRGGVPSIQHVDSTTGGNSISEVLRPWGQFHDVFFSAGSKARERGQGGASRHERPTDGAVSPQANQTSEEGGFPFLDAKSTLLPQQSFLQDTYAVMPSGSATRKTNAIALQSSITQEGTEMLQSLLLVQDIYFHYVLYLWMLANNLTDVLLRVNSPYLLPFLASLTSPSTLHLLSGYLLLRKQPKLAAALYYSFAMANSASYTAIAPSHVSQSLPSLATGSKTSSNVSTGALWNTLFPASSTISLQDRLDHIRKACQILATASHAPSPPSVDLEALNAMLPVLIALPDPGALKVWSASEKLLLAQVSLLNNLKELQQATAGANNPAGSSVGLNTTLSRGGVTESHNTSVLRGNPNPQSASQKEELLQHIENAESKVLSYTYMWKLASEVYSFLDTQLFLLDYGHKAQDLEKVQEIYQSLLSNIINNLVYGHVTYTPLQMQHYLQNVCRELYDTFFQIPSDSEASDLYVPFQSNPSLYPNLPGSSYLFPFARLVYWLEEFSLAPLRQEPPCMELLPIAWQVSIPQESAVSYNFDWLIGALDDYPLLMKLSAYAFVIDEAWYKEKYILATQCISAWSSAVRNQYLPKIASSDTPTSFLFAKAKIQDSATLLKRHCETLKVRYGAASAGEGKYSHLVSAVDRCVSELSELLSSLGHSTY